MMKKTVSLVKTQLQIYFKGSTFIMPLIVSVIFLYTMYTIKPQQIVSSYLVSSVFLFFVMVWVGLSVNSGENIVTEQILLLRVQSVPSYYASKVIFLICIALLADVLYALFPVIQNILNGGDMFTRQMLVSDVINALLLQGGSAFAGAALGSLLHPRVMKNRKLAIVLTVFFTTLTLTSTSLTAVFPALKAILWVVPPVMIPAEIYGKAEYFSWGSTGALFAALILYGIIYSAMKSIICHRNKF